MVQSFSRCILCSKDDVDLDELLAAKLVSFLMDKSQEILSVPCALKAKIEEHVAHLQRVQVRAVEQKCLLPNSVLYYLLKTKPVLLMQQIK